ncbi:PAS domain-containing sensor histidine kinase [Nostoc sp.]|uniref:PAS domain-containing sensor histidine kinase n=1 Tax=Nostoc sp. TaxID=1180 RepID=UPI002FF825F5
MISSNGILEQNNFKATVRPILDHDVNNCQQNFLDLQITNTALEPKVKDLLIELNAAKEQLSREKDSYQQIETKLEKSLSLLQATLDSTADGIIAINYKGEIVGCNQNFFQMWQIPYSIAISRNYEQYLAFYKNQLKAPETFYKRTQALNSQLNIQGYDILELKDDRTFEQYCQPLRLGEQIIGTVWSFREITAHKQTEREIRFALEQEKLFNEHRAHFFSMVSHEFRTPLNIISLSTSLLKRHLHRWTEEKKLQYLQRLQTAVEQISQLTDEIFINGKAEVGKLKFEPKPLNPIQFCRDILAEMNLNESNATCSNFGKVRNAMAPRHTVTLVSQSDCTVCLDKKLLQPILRNLLSNAVKYSPSDSTIDLVVACRDGEVIFQIKDQGIGISIADQQRLFKPFHRGANVAQIPGNGLGLALVKKLIDLHGGQITVVSEVGVGTKFTITLPLL